MSGYLGNSEYCLSHYQTVYTSHPCHTIKLCVCPIPVTLSNHVYVPSLSHVQSVCMSHPCHTIKPYVCPIPVTRSNRNKCRKYGKYDKLFSFISIPIPGWGVHLWCTVAVLNPTFVALYIIIIDHKHSILVILYSPMGLLASGWFWTPL